MHCLCLSSKRIDTGFPPPLPSYPPSNPVLREFPLDSGGSQFLVPPSVSSPISKSRLSPVFVRFLLIPSNLFLQFRQRCPSGAPVIHPPLLAQLSYRAWATNLPCSSSDHPTPLQTYGKGFVDSHSSILCFLQLGSLSCAGHMTSLPHVPGPPLSQTLQSRCQAHSQAVHRLLCPLNAPS